MRRAFILVGVAGSLGLTACVGGGTPPPPPPTPSACAGAAAATTEAPSPEPPPPPASDAPIPPGAAGAEARQEVAESEQRTADGRIPLVTAEQSAGGQLEITTTPVADADQAAAVANERAADGDLVAVEVDAPVSAVSHNNPTAQYALDSTHLRIEDAWTAFAPGQFTAGSGQVIAVIDTGVYASHPDLSGKVLSGAFFLHSDDGGTAFSGPGGTSDPSGHGTYVAGIAAATANNGVGIAGAAPGAQILPVQVLCANGSGFTSDVASGVDWAVSQGATVINLSLGSPNSSSVLQQAIQNAVQSGVTVVAAGGNCGQGGSGCGFANSPSYPGAFPEVLAVAATDSSNLRAAFSTSGAYVDLAAPGVAIVSTWNDGGYRTINGTSMASPHVAGSAALVRGKGCNRAQTEARLRTTAQDLAGAGVDNDTGHGLVRPDQAVLTCV